MPMKTLHTACMYVMCNSRIRILTSVFWYESIFMYFISLFVFCLAFSL